MRIIFFKYFYSEDYCLLQYSVELDIRIHFVHKYTLMFKPEKKNAAAIFYQVSHKKTLSYNRNRYKSSLITNFQ